MWYKSSVDNTPTVRPEDWSEVTSDRVTVVFPDPCGPCIATKSGGAGWENLVRCALSWFRMCLEKMSTAERGAFDAGIEAMFASVRDEGCYARVLAWYGLEFRLQQLVRSGSKRYVGRVKY